MPASFEKTLLDWYSQNKRALPWRENPTPYRVWLSEIMLQQTRVQTVEGYYSRFLKAYPDVESLAQAREEDVFKLWEGLGYYSRARNLLSAAKIVAQFFHGAFPSTKKELLELPGVGDYTASAISAIAFGQREIAVDGNLIRVYARLNASEVDPKNPKAKEEVRSFLQSRCSSLDPSSFNQALMDLGELVCFPNGNPNCHICPFAKECIAHQRGEETKYPAKSAQKVKESSQMTVFRLVYQGRIVLRKRNQSGLLAGLYELPNVEGWLNEAKANQALSKMGFEAENLRPLGEAKHVFTHRVWEMKGYEAEVSFVPKGFVAVSPQERKKEYTLPSAFSYFEKN